MAKLSPGDAVAINVNYHKSCHTKYYTDHRSGKRLEKRKNCEVSIEDLALGNNDLKVLKSSDMGTQSSSPHFTSKSFFPPLKLIDLKSSK